MSTLVYTPGSMVKKVFRQGERSLSRQELESRLENTYGTQLEQMGKSPVTIIDEVLELGTPFHTGASHAVIEMDVAFRDHIAEELVRYFLENKGPLTAEQCVKKLRRMNVVSYSFQMDKLPLQSDARFVQFEGSDLWYLARWKIANDALYAFLSEHQVKHVPLTQLYMQMEHELNLSRREYTFVLEGDERMRVVDDLVLVAYAKDTAEAEPEPSAEVPQVQEVAVETVEEEPQLPKDTQEQNQNQEVQSGIEEVAVAMVEVKTASVLEDVVVNVQDSTEKLELRIKEMEEEVLNHFKVNNMSAISQLVAEKEHCEQIVVALENVMKVINKQ
ncbi:hypothetical protein DFP93_1179 [Aneurinibacillus soli]|uniref:Uncharacterized protein n=1 Tax=Aneurinibacillus soli TaxID=1500254 RepID=A0A0U4WLB9_9BACL|nr:hypothetical protein [Aneurinibacillus soli]PYE59446.1 hypothetical protein DFP93_1179 [Aneurinibacillus soli]BAU29224.1 hypothetical protein CB4_03411 [Aneurinibacillus soli]